jgi:hypothetical protein
MKAFLVALAICALFAAPAVLAGPTHTNSPAGGLYRTIVSTNTGQYAVADSQKEVVTLYDKSDHVIWTTNVVMGSRAYPIRGERKISGMHLYKGDLSVHVGRAYGVIVIKTGVLLGFEQN